MKSKVLLFSSLIIIIFYQRLNSQCSITTSVNASALTCGVAPLSACGGFLYIGDGTNPMTLTMDAALNLTCLGPIQLIVRNGAALDFSSGNDYLTLAAGSSISFLSGSNLIGGSCNASERIYIGANLIASCNGNGPGADYSFAQLLALGGYNIVTAITPPAVCGSGTFILSFTANAIPGSGSVINWYNAPSGGTLLGTGTAFNTPPISTTTTYYVEAFYSLSGFTTPRIAVVATVNASATWNGVSWDVPPSITKKLIFNNNYTSTGSLTGCSCRVNIGNIVFNSGHTLTLADDVIIAGGSLTFNNNASLVQINSSTNSGNITYNRNTTPVINRDYTYWSSPTSGFQTLLNFSPNTQTGRFFTYHNTWAYTTPSTDVFAKGVGYAIWAPTGTNPIVPTILAHQFIGVPNNGDVDVSVTLGASLSHRLIGNPYPSTLDADAFINANIIGTGSINQTISGTLYFWTHNHTLSGNNYLATDYATYNLSGGTAVPTGTGNTTTPTRYIATGDGFMVNTVASGNVSFRNNMRTGINNTNFYKTSNSNSLENELEKHRIWLNLGSNNESISQALIGYIEKATNDYNPGFDGLYFGTNQHAIYSIIKNESFTIQGRRLPFLDSDIVPIGYVTEVAGNLSISIDHVDGIFSEGQNVYLEDKLLNVIHDLKNSSYDFYTESGTTNNRFLLRYTDKLLNTNENLIDNTVTIYPSKNDIIINTKSSTLQEYVIYDVLGRILILNKTLNTNNVVVNSILKNNQTLIVKVTLDNGQTITKKILF